MGRKLLWLLYGLTMCHFLGKRAEFSSSERARYLRRNLLIFLFYLEVSGSGESANRCAGVGQVRVLPEAPQLLSAANSAPSAANEKAEARRRCSGLAPDPLCSIFEGIQVRRATGVTGASGND